MQHDERSEQQPARIGGVSEEQLDSPCPKSTEAGGHETD